MINKIEKIIDITEIASKDGKKAYAILGEITKGSPCELFIEVDDKLYKQKGLGEENSIEFDYEKREFYTESRIRDNYVIRCFNLNQYFELIPKWDVSIPPNIDSRFYVFLLPKKFRAPSFDWEEQYIYPDNMDDFCFIAFSHDSILERNTARWGIKKEPKYLIELTYMNCKWRFEEKDLLSVNYYDSKKPIERVQLES